jgi:polyisoprenoid-binding protein YceI
VAWSAQAVEYKNIAADKSSVTFGYKQMGVAMDGKFKKLSAQISFDPAKPAAAKAKLEIELSSVDTGSDEADQELAGKTWFNTAAFPKASFELTQIKSTGANQFEAVGKLTIKGKSVDQKVPLKYVTQGANGVFTGSFVIHRADFAIGEGSWSKFDVVANDIQVNFSLTAQAGK